MNYMVGFSYCFWVSVHRLIPFVLRRFRIPEDSALSITMDCREYRQQVEFPLIDTNIKNRYLQDVSYQ